MSTMPLPACLDGLPDDIEVRELVSRIAVAVGGPISEHADADAHEQLVDRVNDLSATAFAALNELAELLGG